MHPAALGYRNSIGRNGQDLIEYYKSYRIPAGKIQTGGYGWYLALKTGASCFEAEERIVYLSPEEKDHL